MKEKTKELIVQQLVTKPLPRVDILSMVDEEGYIDVAMEYDFDHMVHQDVEQLYDEVERRVSEEVSFTDTHIKPFQVKLGELVIEFTGHPELEDEEEE